MKIITDYTIQYGGLLRIYVPPVKPTVVITDPEVLRIILTSNKEVAKAQDYSFFKPWMGNGLLVSEGKELK